VFDKVNEAKVKANPETQYVFVRTLKQSLFEMTATKVELFYCPVFKDLKVPKNEELQQMIVIYFAYHPELKPQKNNTWYRSKVSLGFNHEAVDRYIIVSPEPLKEPDYSDGTVRYSSIELYNFLKKGTLLMETAENLPKRLKWGLTDCLHHNILTTNYVFIPSIMEDYLLYLFT